MDKKRTICKLNIIIIFSQLPIPNLGIGRCYNRKIKRGKIKMSFNDFDDQTVEEVVDLNSVQPVVEDPEENWFEEEEEEFDFDEPDFGEYTELDYDENTEVEIEEELDEPEASEVEVEVEELEEDEETETEDPEVVVEKEEVEEEPELEVEKQPKPKPNNKGKGNRKLTEDDVKAIRVEREEGSSYKVLAEEYGVSMTAIRNICIRNTWAHVE